MPQARERRTDVRSWRGPSGRISWGCPGCPCPRPCPCSDAGCRPGPQQHDHGPHDAAKRPGKATTLPAFPVILSKLCLFHSLLLCPYNNHLWSVTVKPMSSSAFVSLEHLTGGS
eukprot:scaffold10840_cov34-Prasinocladus_malaysianus.AAC.1